MRRWLASMIVMSGLSGSAACSKVCALDGCVDGAVLHFSTTFGTPGMYAITGTRDGKSFSCRANLLETPATESCDVPDVDVLFDGQDSVISGLSFTSTPMKVVLRVDNAGGEIASGESTLAYRDVYPNGEGCGSCHFAEQTIMLSGVDGGT